MNLTRIRYRNIFLTKKGKQYFSFEKDNFEKKRKMYEEICQKEKEKIKFRNEQSKETYFWERNLLKFVLVSFAGISTIYFLQQVWLVFWNFYRPYKEIKKKEQDSL